MSAPELLRNQVRALQRPGTKIGMGRLVALDGGYAGPGRTAKGLQVLGVSSKASQLPDGSEPRDIVVNQGIYPFTNSRRADEITEAHVGRDCFMVTDDAVALTDGDSTRSRAGVVAWVNTVGVWVHVGPIEGLDDSGRVVRLDKSPDIKH